MEDKYENTLGPKADLLTTDFIRTVGSSGVSYKNLVSDVAKTIVENYTSTLAGTTQSIKQAINALKAETDAINAGLLDKTYPVGSIYISYVNTDPGTIFGGTWTRLKDRFLISVGDTFTAHETGGSRYPALVEHSHTLSSGSVTVNTSNISHTHTIGGNTGQNSAASASHSHTTVDYAVTANGGVGVVTMTDGALTTYKVIHTAGTSASRAYLDTNSKTITFPQHTHSLPANTGTGGATNHTHTASLSGSTGTRSYDNGSTKGGNLPPYLAVYMWRRTA